MMIGFITHPDCLLHEMGQDHPESPLRLYAIDQALAHSTLNQHLKHYQAPLATREQLSRVHEKTYLDMIFRVTPKTGYLALDPDTTMNPATLNAALRASGAVINAVDLIMRNEVDMAFCAIRPPGHHAEHHRAMGFCFFNNLAVGVAHALSHYPLSRIAIIDFDVHHGNGTEDIFKQDRRVLFCSSFEHPFYPNSGSDTRSDHIINLPLPAGTTGKEWQQAVTEKWLEPLRQFKPEMIFVSAGFDGHQEDPLADFKLVESDYAWLATTLKKIADEFSAGRIVSVLEGGYALKALGRSVVAYLHALLT